MATESFVVSTLSTRLAQADTLLEWLITRHPDKASLARALESVRTAQIIVTNTFSAAD